MFRNRCEINSLTFIPNSLPWKAFFELIRFIMK